MYPPEDLLTRLNDVPLQYTPFNICIHTVSHRNHTCMQESSCKSGCHHIPSNSGTNLLSCMQNENSEQTMQNNVLFL